ncbi:MAG: tRNA pseudouridine(13) synthase TruD [Gammaproteobacteria bacterium]|uniref:tRNA pseudouridine synthase D n=1 Tax=Candidatus Thiopontia autotrophica TaxID=2841688 RepID=A0A8J6NYH7_9GAMM|nr:tRNA pseudouridine(13) synthase TruD [Candidatus Thiopontia autotrophica]MBL6968902.1 tRNA pseudouridine(13) synthase TruD [Gammaproteobacteria bacterium]
MVQPLPYAYGAPSATAKIRSFPEDFQVIEDLGFAPSGHGQHQMIEIEKREMNSDQVASILAKYIGVKRRDVGMAGLKDRFAITRQWFSVDVAGREIPDWRTLEQMDLEQGQSLRIIQVHDHAKKIRRGALKGNSFKLILRDVEGDREELELRLEMVKNEGIPNYFGEQRFGRGGGNVERALQMFNKRYRPRGKHERGLLLSSVRSEIFNRICAKRVEAGIWNHPLGGEVYALARSRAWFHEDEVDEEILRRVAEHDIHPTAPLWGRGRLDSTAEAKAFEESAIVGMEEMCGGLEYAGLSQDRRALRVVPDNMNWSWLDGTDLELDFWLPSGSYATVVMREIVSDVRPLQ